MKRKHLLGSFVLVAICICLVVNVYGKKKANSDENDIANGAKRITTYEQLKEIQNDLDGNYILEKDIDLEKVTDWVPIGDEINAFTGTFDGNGHVLYNLKIKYQGQYQETPNNFIFIGFFGKTRGATIKNLGIENASYEVSWEDYEEIDQEAFSCVGGIIGGMDHTVLENSYFIGEITHSAGEDIYVRNGSIACLEENQSLIKNCYSNSVSVANAYSKNTMAAGGIAWLANSKIQNCYAAGRVRGENETSVLYLGGINASGDDGEVINCVSMLDELEDEEDAYDIDEIGNYCDQSNCIVLIPGEEDIGKIDTYKELGWDIITTWNMRNSRPVLRKFREKSQKVTDYN